MIKKIHQIWIQGEEHFKQKEANLYEVSKLWQVLYPDFEYKLWSESDFIGLISEFSPKLTESYNLAPNFACKSDIARYIILYNFGGLYVDTDYEPFTKRFDYLFANTSLLLVRSHLNKSKILFNPYPYNQAFIYAGEINHVLFKTLLQKPLNTAFDQTQHNAKAYTLAITGPEAFANLISEMELEKDVNVRILPHCMVEVAHFSNIVPSFSTQDEILKDAPFAIGIHRLAGSWVPGIQSLQDLMVVYSNITDWSDIYLIICIFLILLLLILLFVFAIKWSSLRRYTRLNETISLRR